MPQRSGKLCVTLSTALFWLPLGKRSSKSHDLFTAKSTVMTTVIEAKQTALAKHKRTPSERNLLIFSFARGMYDAIKKALGPTLKSSGEVVTDK